MSNIQPRCKVCAGWGKGLVGANGKCKSCTKQAQDIATNPHLVPTKAQAETCVPITNEQHAQLWTRRHYTKLRDDQIWRTTLGEKREETPAMPLPEKMTLEECIKMAKHYGFGAKQADRTMCTCSSSGWLSYVQRCTCPVETWIVYLDHITVDK